MRIAILTDTHFGARNDSQQFLDYFLGFIENQFLPECEKQNIDTVLHLGDLMDRRKFVNFNTLNQVRERFIEKLEERNMKMYCLIGNHDTYFKNTNEVNSLTELFGKRYNCFVPIDKPTDISLGGKVFGMVPWINKENKEECDKFLEKSDLSVYENKYIKMFVLDGKSQSKLDAFVDMLYDAKVGSLTIVENDAGVIEDTDVADMSLDTLALIYKEAEDFYETIEGINVSKLKRLIQEIYMEALSQ
jgi:UDP-2,3-diacylglucosamine pyrophosphatase LpxH